MASNNKLIFYFIIFAISGFSGLIYESIWSRYLKLFLGHAAYAQMMVLIIFMGGMAIGSTLAAKYSWKIKNLIICYAAVELIVGIFGFVFHSLFTSVMGVTFEHIIPNLESSFVINTAKFLVSGALILPQSILLGATFPLITAGLIRLYPHNSGDTIARLYFLNSLGAALGVLANAFFLIPKVGLPGAAMTSGIINIFLAIVVYRLAKNDNTFLSNNEKPKSFKFNKSVSLFLVIAFITGMASFMYEIAWIRMLSLVLGASTDAFELMLSSFILGLAIGSWVIRKRIQQLKKPIITLAIIQILMGIFALLTITFYNYTFDFMSVIKSTLQANDAGYVAYNLSSYFICILVMLPTTICAGMTLPLITHILFNRDKNEASIGMVYGLNTCGAIVGVIASVYFIMPLFGLEVLLTIGAAFDICLGIFLVARYKSKTFFKPAFIILPMVCLIFISLFSSLDIQKMSSGVFRSGSLSHINNNKILFHEDGKTTTVAITSSRSNETQVSISNNGKPDASLFKSFRDEEPFFTPDEPTMVLLGFIPFVHHPEAGKIANIGFGSGLTSEVILRNPKTERLDTIEIEEKVVEAGKYFAPKVSKVYSDPRSAIHIDDAKTFFVSNKEKYDIIISEPPNPWVSGTSSLFTQEFYQLISKYLEEDGVLAQWIHGYEIDESLISTIYFALRTQFAHVELYNLSRNDLLFVTSNHKTRVHSFDLNSTPELKKYVEYIEVENIYDVNALKVGDERLLDIFFGTYGRNINSDYFPLLDNGAAKTRHKGSHASKLIGLGSSRISHQLVGDDFIVDELSQNDKSTNNYAKVLLRFINDAELSDDEVGYSQSTIQAVFEMCNLTENASTNKESRSAEAVVSYAEFYFDKVPASIQTNFIDKVFQGCGHLLSDSETLYLKSIRSTLNKNYQQTFDLMVEYASALEESERPNKLSSNILLLAAAKTGITNFDDENLRKISDDSPLDLNNIILKYFLEKKLSRHK